MRMCFVFRCASKGMTLATPSDAVLLSKIMCPIIKSSELASMAADTAKAVPRLDVQQVQSVLELFSRHKVRYEPLMFSCLWKIFKADWPTSSVASSLEVAERFAACTAATFRVLCFEGLTRDPQLVAIGLGRCVECAPHLNFNSIVDIYEGLKFFNRSYFSLAEAALHSKDSIGPCILREEPSSSTLASQPNIVDILCNELEARLNSIDVNNLDDKECVNVVRLLESLAVVGITHTTTLSKIHETLEHVKMPWEQLLKVLENLQAVHLRVIDVLEHEENNEVLKEDRSAFVKMLTVKLLKERNSFHAFRNPQLVLDFRRLFEKFPEMADDVPQLWDAIRKVRVAHKHVAQQNSIPQRRPKGSLFDQRYAVKVKPIVPDTSEFQKYVPPQFKKLQGQNGTSSRYKRSSTPQKGMYKSHGDNLKGVFGDISGSPSTLLKKETKSNRLLPLVPVSAALKLPPLPSSLAQGSSASLAAWPSKKKNTLGGSRAPLAIQLETFVRNEHRLYLREHINCTHRDTLHIVKEAFAVLIGHFMEYSGILSLIRDEYEACFEEMLTEVKRLRAIHLENESDRSLHVMGLMRQRESTTAVISNQQAQLKASQGLVHSLRDQLGSLEEINSSLVLQLDSCKKELADIFDGKKVLANALAQEAGRSSHFMELSCTNEQEIARLLLLVNSLKENLEESDNRYRALTKKLLLGDMEKGLQSIGDIEKKVENDVTETQLAEEKVPEPYEKDLQRRIDDLLFAYEELSQRVSKSSKDSPKTVEPATHAAPNDPEAVNKTDNTDDVVTTSQLIQRWLDEEHLTEKDLGALDFLLPPGKWEDHPLGFLNLCHPVRNRHLRKKDIIRYLRRFWVDRESHRQVPLRRYFLQWLSAETGSERTAKEVALNIYYICENNLDDPECRSMQLVMKFFLPEELIITGRKIIFEITELCGDSDGVSSDYVQISFIVGAVRRVMPELGYAHMLQLRLYLWRLGNGSGKVAIRDLLKEGSHFFFLLRKGFLDATEEFTLQIVEGVRDISKDDRMVRLQDVAEVIVSMDKGMAKGTLHRILAEATQLPVTEVVTAENDFTVRVQPLLRRFRTAVLLRRSAAILPVEEK